VTLEPFPFEEFHGSPDLWEAIHELRSMLAEAEDILAAKYPGLDSACHPVLIGGEADPGKVWFDGEVLLYQDTPRKPQEPKRVKTPVCQCCRRTIPLSEAAKSQRAKWQKLYETRLGEYNERVKTPEPILDVLSMDDTEVLKDVAEALPKISAHLRDLRDFDPQSVDESVRSALAFLKGLTS